MIYFRSTFGVIIIFITFGIIIGLIYELFKLLKRIANDTYYINIIMDFIYCVTSGFLFILLIYIYTYGEFKLFEVIACGLGVYLEQNFLSKMFANAFKFVYNKVKSKKN